MAKYLNQKIALVTGATGGIGMALVKALASEGAIVAIHYSKNRDKAEKLLAEIDFRGNIVCADLSTPQGAEQLWQDTIKSLGHIDILINNAGIRSELELDANLEQWHHYWQREFQVNFFTAVDLCKFAVSHFMDIGGGKIVNMASRAAQRGYATNAMAYGASKAALINLTKSIAINYARNNINTIALAPGWVRTDMAEDYIAIHGEEAACRDIPTGKMATPEEVAALICFFLRADQSALNGATIDMNGGSYIR